MAVDRYHTNTGGQVTTLNRETLRALYDKIDRALAALGAAEGVAFKINGGKYQPDGKTATLKLDLSVLGANGTAEDKTVLDWKRSAAQHGLNPAWLGKQVTLVSAVYTIVGLKASAKKNVVLLKGQNGTGYACTADAVLRALRPPAVGVPTGAPRGWVTCEFAHAWHGNGQVGPCTRPAKTSRKSSRWGDQTIGEPVRVETRVHLCDECAADWDESVAEGRAEARSA